MSSLTIDFSVKYRRLIDVKTSTDRNLSPVYVGLIMCVYISYLFIDSFTPEKVLAHVEDSLWRVCARQKVALAGRTGGHSPVVRYGLKS